MVELRNKRVWFEYIEPKFLLSGKKMSNNADALAAL